ncbi:MAG: asparagine synthase-related protein [Pseudonocardiales bacterium]
MIGWARLRRIAVWSVLAEALCMATTSRAASLMALASELSGGGRRRQRGLAFARWHPRLSTAGWATPRAREIAADAARCAAGRVGEKGEAGIGAALTVQAIQTVGRTARADAQAAQHYRVRLHNPLTDSQVIAACLSVPAWQRHTPYQYKPLLTTALADLLPAEIAARRTKGDFTSDHYLGLRANASALHELADGRLAALGLVHPVRLRQLLTQVEAGLPVISSDFEPVLAAEVWLRVIAAVTPSALWERCATSVEVAS